MAAGLSVLGMSAGPATASRSSAPAEAEDPPGAFTYLRSDDGGARFTSLELDDVDEAVGITHVDADGGLVHALFDSVLVDDDEKVLYRRSTDGGHSFEPSIRLDVLDEEGTPRPGQSTESDLEAAGDAVHVVWEDDPVDAEGKLDPCCSKPHVENNRDDILYTVSSHGGASFAVPVNLTDNPAVHNRDPDVAVAGDLVAVVYEGEDVTFEEEEDGGAPAPPGYEPQTNADDVLFKVSVDGGRTWSSEMNLSMMADFDQDEPAIDATETTIHLVYRDRDDDGDHPRIQYVRSTDEGTTFSDPEELPGPDAEHAAIVAAGRVVHVVACTEADNDQTADLLYYRSTNDGRDWEPPVVLASHGDDCGRPAIDAHGHDVHVVYSGEDGGLEPDVYHVRSDDGGDTFSGTRNLSHNSLASETPDVSVDPGDRDSVHVAWRDETFFLFALDRAQELALEEDGETRTFATEDVVQYRGGTYRPIVDGSDVGLAGRSINAVARLSRFEFVLSFAEAGEVPGVGRVEASDLVLFTATKLGESTKGTFALFFDGSDIKLNSAGENIDALDVVATDDGVDLYISTTGNFNVRQGKDRPLKGGGEDIFVCREATTGRDSACEALEIAFDGSEAGFSGRDEGIGAFSFDGTGPEEDDEFFAYFSTDGPFSVSTAEGGPSDIVQCEIEEVDLDEDPDARPLSLADCGSEAAPLGTSFHGEPNGIEARLAALAFEFES